MPIACKVTRSLLVGAVLLGAVPGPAGAAEGPPSAGVEQAFCTGGATVDVTLPPPARVAPIRLDGPGGRRWFRYAFAPGGAETTSALIGISHEYTCHVARDGASRHPELAHRYCALGNVEETLDGMVRDGLNVFRLYGVFNHGLGASLGESEPYPFEQPFARAGAGWDLARLEPAYLDRLESVVRAAYCRHLVVELTLLDPWDGDFASGPFAAGAVAAGAPGLQDKADFLRPGNRAERFQQAAVQALVERLEGYPNLIWEVANEPDLAPDGISTAEVVAFERRVIEEWILPHDERHLIMVNGHQPGAFGWELPRVSIASAHYVELRDRRFGALELARAPQLVGARAPVALAFNEGRALGSEAEIDAADVRAEAWEFLFAGGSLFDAYSVDREAPQTRRASVELGFLARVFRAPGDFFRDLSLLRTAECGAVGWCDGLPAADMPVHSCAPDARLHAAALASADGTELALYVHAAATVGAPGAPQSVFARYDALGCAGLDLPRFVVRPPSSGCWQLRWIDPRDGTPLVERTVAAEGGRPIALPATSPTADAAFFARRVGETCAPR